MENYFLKSSVTIFLFYMVYKFFFSDEKSYLFNRFLLITGIIISIVIPLVKINLNSYTPSQGIHTTLYHQLNETYLNPEADVIGNHQIKKIITTLYLMGIVFFMSRFIYNLIKLLKLIKSSSKLKKDNTIIVLVPQSIVPFSFLNSIFVDQSKYENCEINPEIITHETAHVIHKHSWDILLVELAKTIFWFNPLWYWYKKSIQLNHEFQADEYVLLQHQNIQKYQSLLIENIQHLNYKLTSSFNFLSLKKRLIMMSKNKKTGQITIKQWAVLPILMFMIALLNLELKAQDSVLVKTDTSLLTSNDDLPLSKEQYYSKSTFILKNDAGVILPERKYSELTEEEKEKLLDPPTLPKKMMVTQENLNDFSNKSNYAIWIDGNVLENNVLKKYKPEDFDYFFNSFVHKNARSERFPQEHQVNLYTKEGFRKMLEELKKPHEGIIKNFYTKNE